MMTIVGYDLILWMKLQIRVFFFFKIKIKINGFQKKIKNYYIYDDAWKSVGQML